MIHKFIKVIKQHEAIRLGTPIYKGCSVFLQKCNEEVRSTGNYTEPRVATLTLMEKIGSPSSPCPFSAWFFHMQFF